MGEQAVLPCGFGGRMKDKIRYYVALTFGCVMALAYIMAMIGLKLYSIPIAIIGFSILTFGNEVAKRARFIL